MSRFFLNFDSSHFFSGHPDDEMNLEGVHAFVDQFADTPVTDLQFCLNAQRSSADCHSRQEIQRLVGRNDPQANRTIRSANSPARTG